MGFLEGLRKSLGRTVWLLIFFFLQMPLWWMLVEHNSRRAPTLCAELEATTNVSAGRFALDADIYDVWAVFSRLSANRNFRPRRRVGRGL